FPEAVFAAPLAFSCAKIDPKKTDRRRRRMLSIACCICLRTSALTSLIRDASSAASGPCCAARSIAGRKRTCHFEGKGRGKKGNVDSGSAGHWEYRRHQRQLIRAKMGKVSALPTVT